MARKPQSDNAPKYVYHNVKIDQRQEGMKQFLDTKSFRPGIGTYHRKKKAR